MSRRPPGSGAHVARNTSDICRGSRPGAASSAGQAPGWRVLAGIGALGGTVGALLGGGTGTITVPALDRLTDLRRSTIHGTATLPNIAVAVVGTTAYALRGGALDVRAGIPLMVGGVLGVRGGARFVARASEHTLRRIFVAVLIVAGAKLLLDAVRLDPIGSRAVLPATVRGNEVAAVALALVLGVIVGAWSAAMGLGGGLLTVPMLALLFGTGLHTAEGTSLMVMLPNSTFAARAHVRQRTASVPIGLRLASGAAPGAVLGALLALALPSRTLGLLFGGFVLFMAARERSRGRARR